MSRPRPTCSNGRKAHWFRSTPPPWPRPSRPSPNRTGHKRSDREKLTKSSFRGHCETKCLTMVLEPVTRQSVSEWLPKPFLIIVPPEWEGTGRDFSGMVLNVEPATGNDPGASCLGANIAQQEAEIDIYGTTYYRSGNHWYPERRRLCSHGLGPHAHFWRDGYYQYCSGRAGHPGRLSELCPAGKFSYRSLCGAPHHPATDVPAGVIYRMGLHSSHQARPDHDLYSHYFRDRLDY